MNKQFYQSFFLVLLLGFSFFGVTNAQVVQIEKDVFDKERTDNEWVGSFTFGYNKIVQQNRLWTLNGNLSLLHFTPKHFYAVSSALNMVRFGDFQALSDGFAQFRINFNHKRKFVLEPFTHLQYDSNRGLKTRWQIGQGLKYHLFKVHKVTLSAGAGLMYEYENWDRKVADSIPNIHYEIHALKNSFYINSIFRIKTNVEANLFLIHQAPLEDFANKSRFLGDFSLMFKISKHLSYNTRLILTDDYIPLRLRTEANIRKFIYFWTQGVTISF